MTKLRQVCAATVLSALASGAAYADATATVGIMSDYIWRGIYTSDSAAFGSLEVQSDNGFYIGTWGADVGNGLEYDLYFGYTGGGENVSWNVGFTGYYFTDEFDDTYQELNLGFNVGFLDFQYNIGDYNNQAGVITTPGTPPGRSRDQTYEYVIATFTPDVGPHYVVGRGDYHHIKNLPVQAPGGKGMWFEVGKDFEIMEDLEFGISALYSPDVRPNAMDTTPRIINLSASNPQAEYALVMHITKTLRLGE